jgi:hypothetical protein
METIEELAVGKLVGLIPPHNLGFEIRLHYDYQLFHDLHRQEVGAVQMKRTLQTTTKIV